MSTIVEIDNYLEHWLAEKISPEMLCTPLSDEIASEVVDHLKQEADRYWFIDAKRSLELANRTIAIGNARNDAKQTALGCGAHYINCHMYHHEGFPLFSSMLLTITI